MPLISKSQYRNYEPGEFSEEQERTCDETIHLIEAFPWEEQRDHLVVALTNPSITIQGRDNDYLKLATFYQGKYVLYYFNARKQLFTRSFPTYQEAYPFIRSFFGTSPFDHTSFHPENTWARHIAIHFTTKDFTFRINPQPTLTYACIGFASTIFFIYGFFQIAYIKVHNSTSQFLAWFFSMILTLVWIRTIALFINHYRSARGKVLMLSKGKDIFYYGPANMPVPFDKKEVLTVTTYGTRSKGSQYAYSRFARVEIQFKSGYYINISCLLMMNTDLILRLAPATLYFEDEYFPFIPLSALTPS